MVLVTPRTNVPIERFNFGLWGFDLLVGCMFVVLVWNHRHKGVGVVYYRFGFGRDVTYNR